MVDERTGLSPSIAGARPLLAFVLLVAVAHALTFFVVGALVFTTLRDPVAVMRAAQSPP
jgi:hypothetical protein